VTSTIERARRHAEIGGRCGELDAGRAQIVDVEFAELVGRHLADESGARAERGDARRRVARRAAADLPAGAHMVVEPGRLIGVDQPHRSLGQPLALEKGVVGFGDHVDDRIADREHVEAGVGHQGLRCGKAAALAVRGRAGQCSRPSPISGEGKLIAERLAG
jgi:hypothetical protein